ncbi:alpha/beta fold hydrolase [Carnobacterium sp. CS13]|uniref:alpha/beta fold hydrolase n=1 Tax=Carnobacterium sp. CS13 TaxID=2800128 RepID=UPI0019129DB6|nr:alpha/beta fold hydrolase [Carnobacterium sp. CS13]QQP70724.1 alpha/beta fold hydrolase [Carnobacterium sp. CS13]
MRKTFLFTFMVALLSIVSLGCQSQSERSAGSINEGRSSIESKTPSTSEAAISSSESTDPLTTNQTTVPTLFIHGYEGTKGTFDGMLSRLEVSGLGEKALTVTVQPDGSVSETGSWQDQAINPLIQVLFADNKNNEWNQADWIKAVLSYLKQTYQIDEVNLVGHSMGGVSSFRYLVTYGNDDSLPTVDKFIAIGAPFNDFVTGNETQTLDALSQDGPSVISERYGDFSAAIQQYPSSTKMLNIVGDLQDGSEGDGTVPIRSGLAIGYLMQTNGLDYHDEEITGAHAHHSQLHENIKVDKLVAEFLWSN